MQRRVEQPDGDGQAVHRFEDAGEILPLERQQRGQRASRSVSRARQDHGLHQGAPVAEEHVLGTAQADALGAEAPGAGRVLRRVGVRPYLQAPYGVGLLHEPVHIVDGLPGGWSPGGHVAPVEVPHDLRVDEWHGAEAHHPSGAVHGDDRALGDGHPARGESPFARCPR